MGSLGPLPPIDVPMDEKPITSMARSSDEQATLDFELDALHRELGVERGPLAVSRCHLRHRLPLCLSLAGG